MSRWVTGHKCGPQRCHRAGGSKDHFIDRPTGAEPFLLPFTGHQAVSQGRYTTSDNPLLTSASTNSSCKIYMI